MTTSAGKTERAAREGKMQDQIFWEQQIRNVCETSLFAT